MYTEQEIILQSFREGKSQRQISRDLHISRKTVKKYLKSYESTLSVGESTTLNLVDHLSKRSGYDCSTRKKYRLTSDIEQRIDNILEDNKVKLLGGLRKQMLKKIDIYAVLQSQGFDISYSTICNYIRSKSERSQVKEAFIRQLYQPGSCCEFDWGEIKLTISGELRRFQLAVFTSAYSNYRFAAIYQRQDTLAFMESHVAFFSYTGGVYSEMVYDNMRVAVAKFVGKHEKEPTQALLNLRGHYQFSHRFCNAYRGNEKGHVERSVEYVRRKAFALKSDFSNIEEADLYLAYILKAINASKQQLTGRSADELFEEEKHLLLKISHPLSCCEMVQLRVDKYATICYHTCRYSVPDNLVGKFVDVKIFSSKIEIFQDNALVAMHDKTYGKHQWIIAIEHYLNTFKRKPGALLGSMALARRKYLKELYTVHFIECPRDFIDLLHYCDQHHIDDQRLEVSVSRLLKSCKNGVTSEKIKALLGNQPTSKPSLEFIQNETSHFAKNLLRQASNLFTSQAQS